MLSLWRRIVRVARVKARDIWETDSQIPWQDYGAQDASAETQETERQFSREDEYYANLEIAPGASFDEIKASYRRLMKEYHPDLNNSSTEKRELAREITQKLNDAYDYLKKKHGK